MKKARITKTIGFKLTLWYSSIFILSSLFLFFIAYFFLWSSLRQEDEYGIRSKMRHLAALYQTGGVELVQREILLDKKTHQRAHFFVRIADSENHTKFIDLPYQWAEFPIKKLERTNPDATGDLTTLSTRGGGNSLEIAGMKLADGYWLQVGQSTEDRERVLANFRRSSWIVMIPLVLLGFVGGGIFAFRALRPLRQLIRTVRSISLDIEKVGTRVPDPKTGDELQELVRLFNEMLEKIDALIKGMKGSLDHVAHDLRTPMTRLRGVVERALEKGPISQVCEDALGTCMEESEQILKMLDTLMDISEAETGVMNLERETVSVAELFERVLDIYGYVAEEKGIRVRRSVSDELSLEADPTRIGQALANLLDNAIKYSPKGSEVCLEGRKEGDRVVMEVRDSGVGIPPNELPRIWDRLYRGDQSRSRRGLGLGLSLVKAIVLAHGGEIGVRSRLGEGSTFTILLRGDK